MTHEEYEVGGSSINSELSLTKLVSMLPQPPALPLTQKVKSISVAKGARNSVSHGVESPIGNAARVYLPPTQFENLKTALGLGPKKVVVRYDAYPMPNSQNPSYEEIKAFSHYTK